MTRQVKRSILKKSDFKYSVETILHYPFHINNNLRVLYVVEGSIQINYVSGSMVLKQKDIECINSREPAEIEALTSSNVVIILEINIDYLQQINPNIGKMVLNINAVQFFPTSKRHNTKENVKNIEILKKMFTNLLMNYVNDFKSQLALHNLNHISKFLIEKFDDVKKHLNCFTHQDSHILDRFRKIDYYIQENISRKIQLEHLVDLVFLSPQYISAEIKEKYCRTFLSIIQYYRTVQAVRLILEDHSIKSYEIINRCGFSNSRYFYRAFKKHMACTPDTFKKNLAHNGKTISTKVLNIQSPEIICHLTLMLSKKDSKKTTPELDTIYGDIKWKEVTKGYYM